MELSAPTPALPVGPDDRPGWAVLGEAELHGVVAMADWPRDAVRALLPEPDVELVSLDGWDAGRHPVVVVYGAHVTGATRLAGIRVPLGRAYHELGVVVPGVRTRAGFGPVATAVVVMYADYFPAVWNGRNRYGFAKQEAGVRWCDTSYVVTDLHGALVCTARVDPAGEWHAGMVPPDLRTVASVFCGGLLGWSPAGRRVCTPSTWHLGSSTFRPVRASVTMALPPMTGADPSELVRRQVAAFEVRGVGWQLGWPAPEPEAG